MAYSSGKPVFSEFANEYEDVGKKKNKAISINGIPYVQCIKPGWQKDRNKKSPGDRETTRMSWDLAKGEAGKEGIVLIQAQEDYDKGKLIPAGEQKPSQQERKPSNDRFPF